MKMIEAQARLQKLGQPVLRSADAAGCLNIATAHASKILGRLAEAGFVIPLARGCWALAGRVDRLVIPERLTAPYPSYVSLQTALYYHQMISQIPEITYAVSLARTRRFETPIGMFSIHHLSPDFFFGYEVVGGSGIKMATPEKALLDLLYLSPARSRLFKKTPEIELPKRFRIKSARAMILRIPSSRRRTIVSGRFEGIISA